ncbi:MAG: hypothetical protein KatS3mg043_0609 [Rhodothermaceae bacterium]|nr:MAG: hypothetical protein KatS3mg043_0609 [Rhodothermaceae bacterium]
MQKTFEALYEDGRLTWLGERPESGRFHVLVTIVDRAGRARNREEVHRVLEATRGACGGGKSLEELDAELEQMRSEWERTL